MAGMLAQFEIKPLVDLTLSGTDVSFTNSALWMLISAVLAFGFLFVATRNRAMVPSVTQSVAEGMYETVAQMIRDNVGSDGKKYFSFVMSLFLFVLFGNLLGMIPGSFTFTSHIAVTFALAGFIFVAVTLIGVFRHGLKFLSFFVPAGVPLPMLVFLVPIEIISYLTRPISLSVRLFANMLVGHVLLKVIGGFALLLGIGALGAVPVVVALVAVTTLEMMVAVIQAYVFAILSCIYLNDALNLH